MPPKGFECKQCGNCCLTLYDAFCTIASAEDIRRWRDRKRYDILRWVDVKPLANGRYRHELWFHPGSGREMLRCPWLKKLTDTEKYLCRIHDVKPDHCRLYPLSKQHAENTGCRAWD